MHYRRSGMHNLEAVSKSLKSGDVWVSTEAEDYHRSVHNKTLLNTNSKKLEDYKLARKVRLENTNKIKTYSEDIDNLKIEVSEIKDSLNQILSAIQKRDS